MTKLYRVNITIEDMEQQETIGEILRQQYGLIFNDYDEYYGLLNDSQVRVLELLYGHVVYTERQEQE